MDSVDDSHFVGVETWWVGKSNFVRYRVCHKVGQVVVNHWKDWTVAPSFPFVVVKWLSMDAQGPTMGKEHELLHLHWSGRVSLAHALLDKDVGEGPRVMTRGRGHTHTIWFVLGASEPGPCW